MAVPFRRTGKTRKNLRRSHLALAKPNLVECPKCGAKVKPHHVCKNCGNYDGNKVLEVNEEK